MRKTSFALGDDVFCIGGQVVRCCVLSLHNLVGQLLLVGGGEVEGQVAGQHGKEHNAGRPHIPVGDRKGAR